MRCEPGHVAAAEADPGPPVGRYSPESMFSVVVLPEPFGTDEGVDRRRALDREADADRRP